MRFRLFVYHDLFNEQMHGSFQFSKDAKPAVLQSIINISCQINLLSVTRGCMSSVVHARVNSATNIYIVFFSFLFFFCLWKKTNSSKV
jgi:hypothetical protein